MRQSIPGTESNKKRWVTIALHTLIWLMVFLIPYIFSADIKRETHSAGNGQNQFLYLNTALDFFWVLLFYFNAGILLPKLLYTRKAILYIISIIALFGLVILVDDMLFYLLSIPRPFSVNHSVEHNFIPFVFTVAASSAYKAFTDKTKADLWIREKQSEHLQTELSFLRSQISPHFLFNVLNNITAMVRLKSDDLEPTVMRLSSLLQYMLYETDEEKVVMKSEAEYLRAYIALQQQRFGDELTLKLSFDIKEEWQAIEPMLLIPFVENAFKHGATLPHPEIHVGLSVMDNKLHFNVRNKFRDEMEIKDKTSGIGLANVKRRLELLYPGKHRLAFDKNDNWFIVELEITL